MAAAALAAAPASAQRPGPTVEARGDLSLGTGAEGALLGAGVLADAGLYARVGLLASAGVLGRARPAAAGEVALVGRFLLDPLRQSARGVYAGGGLAARAARGGVDPFALVVVGVEGRPRGRWAPAVELGIGHGARIAVALRRARPGRR